MVLLMNQFFGSALVNGGIFNLQGHAVQFRKLVSLGFLVFCPKKKEKDKKAVALFSVHQVVSDSVTRNGLLY